MGEREREKGRGKGERELDSRHRSAGLKKRCFLNFPSPFKRDGKGLFPNALFFTSARSRRQDLEQQHDERREVRQVAGEAEEVHLALFARADDGEIDAFFFFTSTLAPARLPSVSLSALQK